MTRAQLNAETDPRRVLTSAVVRASSLLDITQTSQQLGKTAGKDTAARKATYPSIVGLDKSRKIAKQLTHRAFDALKIFGTKSAALAALATHLLQRTK